MRTSIILILVFLTSSITTISFAGSGTESDPYTIAEARALPESSTMVWAKGYIVGGRYDDFDAPFENVSGDTNIFEIGALPSPIGPNGSSDVIQIVYAPGFLTGVSHSAIYNLLCNDPGNPTNQITISGGTLFVGEITISNIQYTTNPSGDSPLVGETVSITGIVTYTELSGYVISEPEGGAWNGVYVYDKYHRPDIGDKLFIEGEVAEYHNLTEIKYITTHNVISKSNSVPTAIIPANGFPIEAYEGVLVSITNVTVSNQKVDDYSWQIRDYSGTCLITQDSYHNLYRYIPKTGDSLDAAKGVGWQFDANRKMQPRDDDDFVGRDVFEYALKGMVMTPSGPQSNWYVHIWDDNIIEVTNAAPTGINIVDTEGIIFPGLIDAHNHPSWNSFPTLMFHKFPAGHRDEWAGWQEYSDWKKKRSTVRDYSSVDENDKATVSKFAEVLELMAGCVAIQGNYNGIEYAHPDVMLFNVEQYPSKVYANIFPWKMDSGDRDELSKKLNGGAVNAVVIHLCEGPDATSHAQFATWKNWGLLTKETAIIHGTSLTSNDFADMAAVGAKLIWSPMSNIKLFDQTANAMLAAQIGVNVGISPDWTPSGCYNLLEELGFAWHLNQTKFGSYFTAKQMCDMVSLNNAISCGIDNRYGKIAVGYNAGLCVIDGDLNDPYMSLINARPKDIKLTIVNGTPRYGDASLIEAIGATGETVNIWGKTKMLNIAFDHPFLNYSQETFATIRNNLKTAHGTLNTTCTSGYLDSDELQFLDLDLLQKGPDNVPPFVGNADNPILSPVNGAQFITDDPATMMFFTNGFWDNLTRSSDLIHKEIAIVPDNNPSEIQMVIATNLENIPANKTVSFTPDFDGSGTNYIFRFITIDEDANATTTLFTNTKFTVIPEPFLFIIYYLSFIIYYLRKR